MEKTGSITQENQRQATRGLEAKCKRTRGKSRNNRRHVTKEKQAKCKESEAVYERINGKFRGS